MNTVEGKIIDKSALIMRQSIGSAALDGVDYELSTSMNGSPIIRNEKNGYWFSLSWEDIINMAINKGLDKDDCKAD